MTIQIYNIANHRFVPGNYSADMHVHPYTSSNELGPRVLELTSVLQTTLDVAKLIDLFTDEIRSDVVFDGLRYQLVSHGIDITTGEQPANTCSYQLMVAEHSLGEIRFFRDHEFSEDETHT